MKHSLLTLAVAAQLAAGGAFAQTNDSGSAGAGETSGAYGSNWTNTLGAAMFSGDGVSLRDPAEIATQWATLSAEDQEIVRSDCAMHMQSGGMTQGADATTGASDGATGGVSDTQSGAVNSSASDGATTEATSEDAADTMADAAPGTGSEGSAGAAGAETDGTSGESTSDASSGITREGSNTMIAVSDEQMGEICAATQGL